MPDEPIYLDHAATCWPRRAGVDEAMRQAMAMPLGNPGRSGHRLAVRAGSIIERARHAAARYAGVDDPRRVCLVPSCTIAANLAIAGVLSAWARARGSTPRPRAIATALEHNAIARPLAEAHARDAIELIVIEPGPDGVVSVDRVLSACDEKTALICCTHASNVLGTIQPVRAIAAGLRAMRNAGVGWPLLLCDAAQTAGLIEPTLMSTDADLLIFAGHKSIGGPTGVGALIVDEAAWRDPGQAGAISDGRWIEPTLHGGTGSDALDTRGPLSHDPWQGITTLRQLPTCFEPGTPSTIAMAGLAAALDALEEAGPSHAHALAMIDQLHAGLRAINRVRVQAGVDDDRWRADVRSGARVGVLSFTVDGMTPQDVASVLDASFGIAVRAGLHCAPWCHRWLGTAEAGGSVRVSVGPTTTDDHIRALIEVLGQLTASL